MSTDPRPDDFEIRTPSLGIVLAAGAAVLLLVLALSVAGGFLLYQRLRQPAPTAEVRPEVPPEVPVERPATAASATATPGPRKPTPRAQRARNAGPHHHHDKWDVWRGQPAPTLIVETIHGERIDLRSLRGKRVVLDFWATWCKPCIEAIPDLNRLAREWGPDVVVVGITYEDRAHVAPFAREKKMEYRVAATGGDDLPAPFGEIDTWPTVFFIDRDGRIQSVLEGYHHYDCLESRFWVGDAAAQWAAGRRKEALALAARTLEVHLDHETEAALTEIFGSDPEYAALHERVKGRVDGLLGLYERKYDRQLSRDRAAVIWAIWSFGAERKDAEAVPHLIRYLRESTLDEARWRAADALWLIDDTRAVPDLIDALGDPSLKVQGFSASALGDLGDPRAVEPLLALFAKLPDNREETKARIADALGKLEDPRAIAPIEKSLTEIREPRYVRWTAPALQRLKKAAEASGSVVAIKP